MKTYRHVLFSLGLLASQTEANSVHSAGASAKARASASVTIVAPVNVSASASKTYKHLLFNNSTGDLTIRIPGVLERVVWPASARAWTLGHSNEENTLFRAEGSDEDRTTLFRVNDGTLIGDQGTSFAFTRASDPDGVVMALLAYN